MNWYTFLRVLALMVVIFIVVDAGAACASAIDKLIADIDKLVTMRIQADTGKSTGNPAFDRLMARISEPEKVKNLEKSIMDKVKKAPLALSSALIPKLQEVRTDSERLATYVLILGHTGDSAVIDPIIQVAQQSPPGSDMVRSSCCRALAMIGGEKPCAFLMENLEQTSDSSARYGMLDLLSEMQCEEAIPLTLEILREPSDPYWWHSLFIFGKMGDKAVPFLIERIDETDPRLRQPAVDLLGSWLVAPAADQALRQHYWAEPVPEIRQLIVASVGRFCPNLDTAEAFLRQAAATDTLPSIVGEILSSLNAITETRGQLERLKKKKHPSEKDFHKQFDLIFESCGLEADFGMLFSSSTLEDEPRLKKLRERILQRNSDECFYDYDKINDIIVLNRLLAR